MLKELLETKVSLLQLMVAGLVVGVPYLLVGAIFALGNSDHLTDLGLVDQGASFAAQVAIWPLLLVADVQLP